MLSTNVFWFLWSGNTVPGRIITAAIVALGGAAGSAAVRHRRRYSGRESQTLDEVRAKLRRMLDAQQPDDPEPGSTPLPPQPVELHELREHVPPDTLIGDRLAALARMKQARVKVNAETLQQMTLLRESASASLAFPGYAVDLAMMLGMLGTFIGLCLMLLQMQGVLPGAAGAPDDSAFTAAATSLGNIIASKKTAFVTTLIGLVCAISVSGLNFLLARAQSAFYDGLERFTTGELLPATVPQAEDESAMEKLSLQLGDSFSQLGSLADHHTQNLERIEAMETAFGTIVESIRTITLQAARAPADETTGALTHVITQLAVTNDSLTKISRNLATVPQPAPLRTGSDAASRRDAPPKGSVGALLSGIRNLPAVPVAAVGVVLLLLFWATH